MPFAGFTTDRLVGLPPELFSEVLPQITLPSELKLTLHLFWRLSRQRGTSPRRASWDELEGDRVLRRSLRAVSKTRELGDLLAEGLEAAVHRGTLLHVVLPDNGRSVNWYVVHTEANRAWVERVALANEMLAPSAAPGERPTLVGLYEENIGMVTPLLLEELREAEERYPAHWVEAAMREAVSANARSWRYIKKVLERWSANGRHDATDRSERPIDVDQFTNGAYGDLFRRGSDTSGL